MRTEPMHQTIQDRIQQIYATIKLIMEGKNHFVQQTPETHNT